MQPLLATPPWGGQEGPASLGDFPAKSAPEAGGPERTDGLYVGEAMAPTPVLSPGKSHGRRGLENPTDGGAWWAAVHGITRSQTRLSDFTFTFHFHALEKEMATHSSVLAWRVPGTGEPGGLPSIGSHRVGHD